MLDSYRVIKYTFSGTIIVAIQRENTDGSFKTIASFEGATQAEAIAIAKTWILENYQPTVLLSGTKAEIIAAASA